MATIPGAGCEAIYDQERGGRPAVFPPLARAAIERVACTDPGAYGLEVTRWDCRTPQQVAVAQAVVEATHSTAVARLLAGAGWQPHRSRSWKTATIGAAFTSRAAQTLWPYERVGHLRRQGGVVSCVDEEPNLQALSRLGPARGLRPGQVARYGFEYKRQGTVNSLVALNVWGGKMWACCLGANDDEHFIWALRQLARRWARAPRIHLVMGNGSSHIGQRTRSYLAAQTRLRPLDTPPRASRLHQAGLLLRAFTGKYLKHFEAASRQHLIDHLGASWPEYDQWFAHRFRWSWTRVKCRIGQRRSKS